MARVHWLKGTTVGSLLVASALALGGCGGVTPTSTAAAQGATAAPAWSTARVEQPGAIEALQTNAPNFCSPCHPILGTYISAVEPAGSGFVALGYESPPAHVAAWSSADAVSWHRIASFPGGDGSLVNAATTSKAGIVAVGADGHAAAAWRSSDGASWTEIALPSGPASGAGSGPAAATSGAGSGAASASAASGVASNPARTEQATAITASGAWLVAGGYAESPTGTRTPVFWRSPDGVTWAAVTPAGPAIGASRATSLEVTGIAATSSAIVAVGISGDERRGTAAAWRSTDHGATWTPVTSPSLAAGRMLAVAAGSRSQGIVAVGENVDQTGARVWESADGSSWTLAPDQPALDNDAREIVPTAIASGPSGFVAVGWEESAGNGSAAVWMSPDGSAWTRTDGDPSFLGAGMSAVLASPRLLAAGTMGWPDTHAATVWMPPR